MVTSKRSFPLHRRTENGVGRPRPCEKTKEMETERTSLACDRKGPSCLPSQTRTFRMTLSPAELFERPF